MKFRGYLWVFQLVFAFLAAGCALALPLGIGAGGGLFAPAGDFGQDLRGALNLSMGFGVFPVDRLRLGIEVSYASLKGKGDADLRLEVIGGEVSAWYLAYSFTEDVGVYGIVGAGNSRLVRTLGQGDERGYQVNGLIGAGGAFRVYERISVDAGLRFRRYFSDKSGDAVLSQIGVWYRL